MYPKSTTPTNLEAKQDMLGALSPPTQKGKDAAKKLHEARYPTGSCLAIAIALSVSLKYLWIIFVTGGPMAGAKWTISNGLLSPFSLHLLGIPLLEGAYNTSCDSVRALP